mmetsp:Transcript_1085/g.1630  ORF Transcript_1085/g.1630 Transcript_1085/m.1630 type:complete len:95 (-) Transcript_1085:1189-1473(-)
MAVGRQAGVYELESAIIHASEVVHSCRVLCGRQLSADGQSHSGPSLAFLEEETTNASSSTGRRRLQQMLAYRMATKTGLHAFKAPQIALPTLQF